MKSTVSEKLEAGRVRKGTWASSSREELTGAFVIMGPRGGRLAIISSGRENEFDEGWEHVSVSLHNRCPNWGEMCFVKDLFWEDHECVIQYHPPKGPGYINMHPYCLHLWRKRDFEFPMPPSIFVGPSGQHE